MREGRPPREPPPWEDSDWRPEVEAWIEVQLAGRGVRQTGPMVPRPRPWSIVLSVPTTGGTCYFKTTAPGMADDASLTAGLATVAPGVVLSPLAVDAVRRWVLLPDGGERLRDLLAREPQIGHWERILPAYAQLQRRMAGREDDVLAWGALDRRPSGLPPQLLGLLAEPSWLRLGEDGGLDPRQIPALRELAPRLAEACDELDAAGIGPSVQHDDLHDGNVLVSERGYRIIDWGDAGLAHPFGTLLVTLRSIADAFSIGDWSPFGPSAPELDRLRDAYLEVWSDLLPRQRLVRLTRLATWTGMLSRALTWRAALPHATEAEYREFGDAIPGWLLELAAACPA